MDRIRLTGAALLLSLVAVQAQALEQTFPGAGWETRTPTEMDFDAASASTPMA